MRGPRACSAALLLCCSLVLPACSSDPHEGYAFSASHDTAVRTVHVPIFDNPTYSRGIEVELTDALVKEIQRSTPWRVTDAASAQVTLSGKITDSSLRRLSVQRESGLAQEIAVRLTVDFDFTDARSGKLLVSRKSFTSSETFAPANPARERLEAGQHATVQQLARDIVAELRSNW